MSGTFHALEWVRLAADTVFLVFGVVPIVVAVLRLVFEKYDRTPFFTTGI